MSSNHLASETSPYLLQHADNPVDWHPWGTAALELAREQNKPILLSIGYSACHWCHVMAHESFEDQATAELMNQLFINIKVDREERPDLDKVYQLAHSVITRRTGGWPLTVFLTPDLQLPIFAGTYFPINPAHGLPAFKEILARIAQFYHTQAEQLEQHTQSLTEFFAGLDKNKQSSDKLDQQPLLAAELELENNFDRQHGGFGAAPKFPHPTSLELCLRLSQTTLNEKNNSSLLHIFEHSLKHMAQGGIYDHLAGGFFRYCVDADWTIPHFEKMLYDNGPLLGLYATAAALTGNDYYQTVTRQTADWVIRDMQSADGAYYATLDADSEGVEGKFYAWTAEEINKILGSDAELFSRCYGLDQPANFEHAWHLQTRIDLNDRAHELQMQTNELEVKLSAARLKLLQQRELRIPPARDEKILCSWNALMIKGMIQAYRCSNNSNYLTSAQNALTFIQENLWQQGRLLAKHNDSNSELPAYLDDYAFLLDALLEILQIRWSSADLHFAVQLAEVLLSQFSDPSSAGFFFTANDHERLIYRPKPYSDDALPSGNGVAAYALTRLGWLLAEPRYLEAVEASLKLASNDMQQSPLAHASMLLALQEQLSPIEIIILRGDESTGRAWHKQLLQHYEPQRMVFLISKDETDLPAALASKTSSELACVAYICQGTHCSKPIDNLDELLKNRARPEISN